MNELIKTPPAKKVDAGRGNVTIKVSNSTENHFVILYLDENNITRAVSFANYDVEEANNYIKLLNPKFNMICITNGKLYQE